MFSVADFFSKCEQIRRKVRIGSHLQKKSSIKNLIFREVIVLVGRWLVKGVGLKFFVGRDYRLLSKFRYHVLKFGIKVSETFNLCFVTDNASICTIRVKNWGFFP